VYSTCLFCNQSLGSNEVVEAFPVGRRLAFDQRRGRLWVVCRKCEKWNLTPLEERWEAIEACERLFRDSRKRLSTDNIGLAKLAEGLELVRIGEPQRPEFAAWRYGDQFGRRRRRQNLLLTTGGVLSTAGMITNSLLGATTVGSVAYCAWSIFDLVRGIRAERRVLVRLPDGSGGEFLLRGKDVVNTRLLPGGSTEEWVLQLRRGVDGTRGQIQLAGAEARRVAARVLPQINKWGSTKKQTEAAVKHLEEASDPQRFVAWVARMNHWRTTTEMWLGVEMAINEENERHALEEELAFLEAAWKDAEEIAAIADRLTLPREVDEKLSVLKRPG